MDFDELAQQALVLQDCQNQQSVPSLVLPERAVSNSASATRVLHK
jgi:hypothetical protein